MELIARVCEKTGGALIKAAQRMRQSSTKRDDVSAQFLPFDPVAFIAPYWKIESDCERLEHWDPAKTCVTSALRPGEKTVTGKETKERLVGKPLLGARAFLYSWNNKEKIPEEWKGKIVFFDAAVLQSPCGDRYSLCLYWNVSEWCWDCYRLDYERYADCVSACAS
jgi:hypothetical protein